MPDKKAQAAADKVAAWLANLSEQEREEVFRPLAELEEEMSRHPRRPPTVSERTLNRPFNYGASGPTVSADTLHRPFDY